MSQTFNSDYRISDTERQYAMDELGKHFTSGRLDMNEYDTRLTSIAEATMKSELTQLFDDLPLAPSTPANVPATVSEPVDLMETPAMPSTEAMQLYRKGRNMKLGVVLASFVASFMLFGVSEFIGNFMLGVTFIVAIALFLMNVGPASWNYPNPRKIMRAQRRDMTMARAKQVMQGQGL